MREIICRFRNDEDLKSFSNGLLSKEVKSVDFINKKCENILFNKESKKMKKEDIKLTKYMREWKEMPEFITDFHKSDYVKIIFKLDNISNDNDWLSNVFNQNITSKTKSVWFPKLEQGEHRNIRVLGGRCAKYPIYVVTKGRSQEYRFSTSNWLTRMCQPHYLCIEEQELEDYKNSKIGNSKYATIVIMDKKYKETYDCLGDLGNKNSTGPGAARNFCADNARQNGFHWCWILDDNSENFDRYWRGRRILSHSPEVFRTVEDFCDRYDNIGLAGLNYSKFCIGEGIYPPYTTNTRIYSYGLWNLDCPQITQEGRYNEDTIQSLNILKAGWCTVQFNCYLGAKVTTQKRPGGNTEEFYKYDEGGTLPKSQMLVDRHPDVSKLVWKFNRWHHEVDYSGFKQELHLKNEYKNLTDETKEHGVYIARIPREMCLSDLDNREDLENMFPKGCIQDITNSNTYL